MASEIKVNTIKDLGGNTIVSSNGSGTISGLPASAISSGTVATARLGSGTASSSTFLAGDSSYKTVAGTTINNNADNRVITGSGTANTLTGEANLTYDGTDLVLTSGSANSNALTVKNTADATVGIEIQKSDYAIQLLVDHDNAGAKNFAIRRESVDGSTSRLNYIVCEEAGQVTMPQQPCFLVTKNGHQSDVPINATTTITFETEITDINANFSSNTFTAPVTGSYQFNFTITWGAYDTDFGYQYTMLVASNRTIYAHLGSGNQIAADGYFNSGGSSVIDMDAGDTCILKVNLSNNGAAQADASQSSFFSGFLIG